MFGKKIKVEEIGVLRLKLRTKILNYIGHQLSSSELEELENEIFAIFGVKTKSK